VVVESVYLAVHRVGPEQDVQDCLDDQNRDDQAYP
jgi:hypothetical protein